MNWWQAVILGLVEGITEYLPVSSTGHLILASELMRFEEGLKPHVDAFNIVIQGGAILAVLGLYWGRVWQMVVGSLRALPLLAKGQFKAQYAENKGFRLALNIFVAFVPAVVLGLALDDWIEATLFSLWPVLGALLLGGVWMIWLDRWRTGKLKQEDADGVKEEDSRFSGDLDDLTIGKSLFIGLFQTVAMWPGTSRSMMTIAGGTLLGLKPRAAAEFSFLLGLPTLGGACVYKLLKNIKEASDNKAILDAGGMLEDGAITQNLFEALGLMPVVIGLVVATVSAAFAVKWLVAFLTKHGLAPFGYYRIVLTVVLGAMALSGLVVVGST